MLTSHRSIRIAVVALASIILSLIGALGTAQAQQRGEAGNAGEGPGVIEVDGGNGVVIRSTNGGKSWESITKEQVEERRSQLARSMDAAGLSNIIHISSITSVGSSVIIRYDLLQATDIEVAICGVNGSTPLTSSEGMQNPGGHSITIDASTLPKGVYCYRIMSGGRIAAAGKLLMDR